MQNMSEAGYKVFSANGMPKLDARYTLNCSWLREKVKLVTLFVLYLPLI